MEVTNKSGAKRVSDNKNKHAKVELSAKHVLKDMGIYLVFLLVATIITISSRSIRMFYLNNTVERLFLNRFTSNKHGLELAYEDLVTVADWWSFAKTTFIEGIEQFDTSILSRNESADGNVLLGPPRLRQIRIQNESCKVNKIFQNEFKTCYGDYKKVREDTSRYLNKEHSSQSQASIYSISGLIANYHGAGYIEMLTFDSGQNEEILDQLKDACWVDIATRLILIEFSIFNNNVNIFCNTKLLAEIPPTGGVVTSSQLHSFKYYPLGNDGGFFTILCSVVFFLLIIHFTITMSAELISKGCSLIFGSVFHILHILVLMIAYLSIAYISWHTFYLKSILKKHENDANHFLSLDIICYWNRLFIDMMGICVFLVWIILFKYIAFNKTMMQFRTTLQRCARDLLGFSIMFAIVFVAFANLAVMIFGAVHSDFCNFSTAILTLMRTVLGDFDYDKLEAANRILGPIFFLSFILFVFFILMNMFLAIINDTYSDVKSEITEGREHQFEKYLKSLFEKLKRLFYRNAKQEADYEIQVEVPGTSSKKQKRSEDQQSKNTETIIDKYFEIISIDRDDGDEDSLKQRVNFLEGKLENLVQRFEGILDKME